MKIYLYAADLYACGHYRMAWPAQALQQNPDSDLEIEIIEPGEDHGLMAYFKEDGSILTVNYPPDADAVVFQRPSFPQLAQVVPYLRSKGVAVIIDIDDDLTCIHPSNPAWIMLHPRTSTSHSWTAVTTACRDATLVTVSTPALTTRYGRGHSQVLYNYVPKAYLQLTHLDHDLIAWAGSTHSHPDDFRPVGHSIRTVVNEGMKFMVVGDGTGLSRMLSLGSEEVRMTGPIAFAQWGEAVSQIGIGVAPLTDTRFNEAKSWLKPLEYSAFGVPWIGSPRAEYVRLHKRGCGSLAEKPKDWLRELRRMKDSAYRLELSERGRTVASALTIEEHAWRWAEVWTDAIKLERSRSTHTRGTALSTH